MHDDDKIVLRELVEHLSIRTPYPGPEGEAEPSDLYSDLRAYWKVVLKRKSTILTVVLILTTLVVIYAFKVKPIYQATGRVEVDAETPQSMTVDQDTRLVPTDPEFLHTQVHVLSSDNLAWQTIQQLRLDLNPVFNPVTRLPKAAPDESRVALQDRLIRLFEDALHVELVRRSRIVRVSFDSPDPRLAANVVNALIKRYIEYNFMTKFIATRQASGWMERQLDELKAKVEKSQQALVDYERQNAIVNVSDKENVVEQRLATLSRNLTAAENDLAQKESLVDLIQTNPSRAALLAQNELLVKLEEKEADLRTEYTDSVARYGPAFPKVTRLKDQLQGIQSMIAKERERTVDRIRRDYEATLAKRKILAAEVSQQKVEVGKLNQLLIQHNILKHEFETNQRLYDSLLKRLKDATVSAGFRATNIHVVDNALVPATPVRPKRLLYISIGFIVALILGVTLAFVQEGLDNSVKNAEEAEGLVPVPSLAVIPLAESASANDSWHHGRNHEPAPSNGSIALAITKNPTSAFAESCRSLCTAILHSTAHQPPQVILLTSTQPGEGKTSISLNLALALAQRGNRVLLVDGDLRKPGFGPALGVKGKEGLCGILTGQCTLEQAVKWVPSTPNLCALPVGHRAPNPAELLSSTSMVNLVGEWREQFDHIIIDSPPLLMVTDATILSRLVDGVVLIVESGATPRNALTRAYKILKNSDAKVLGTVLNKMDFRNDGYYGYAYKTYHASYYSDEPAKAHYDENNNDDKTQANSSMTT